MKYKAINFASKLNLFTEHWQAKIIAKLNDYRFKVVKIQGEFVWHEHNDTDEAFIVLKGEMTIKFRDGAVSIQEGEMFVVPKVLEHKPVAHTECQILLIEPKGVLNTGNEVGELTAANDVWL